MPDPRRDPRYDECGDERPYLMKAVLAPQSHPQASRFSVTMGSLNFCERQSRDEGTLLSAELVNLNADLRVRAFEIIDPTNAAFRLRWIFDISCQRTRIVV
jgi:hypothetical protein